MVLSTPSSSQVPSLLFYLGLGRAPSGGKKKNSPMVMMGLKPGIFDHQPSVLTARPPHTTAYAHTHTHILTHTHTHIYTHTHIHTHTHSWGGVTCPAMATRRLPLPTSIEWPAKASCSPSSTLLLPSAAPQGTVTALTWVP